MKIFIRIINMFNNIKFIRGKRDIILNLQATIYEKKYKGDVPKMDFREK